MKTFIAGKISPHIHDKYITKFSNMYIFCPTLVYDSDHAGLNGWSLARGHCSRISMYIQRVNASCSLAFVSLTRTLTSPHPSPPLFSPIKPAWNAHNGGRPEVWANNATTIDAPWWNQNIMKWLHVDSRRNGCYKESFWGNLEWKWEFPKSECTNQEDGTNNNLLISLK